MQVRYSRFDPDRVSRQQRLEELMRLFRELLTHAAGDVEKALEWLDQIARKYGLWRDDLSLEDFKAELTREGQITRGKDGGFRLTPRGEKALRHHAFADLFGVLRRGSPGEHRSRDTGPGGEALPEVRAYEFGDELWSIAPTETLHNAVRGSFARGEDSIRVTEEDLAVRETELASSCATALLVDCSHSMVLYGEDRMTPARKVALGLVELIKTKFPKDRLHVIAFGDDAVEVPLEEVPYLSWGRFHTNTKAALQLGRNLLMRSRYANRQVFLITDGKPTVLDEGGRRYIDSGWLNPRIVNRTLDEAVLCRRKHIPITTFMMTDDPVLGTFVDDLTRLNRGRAYYTSLDNLGQFVLVDYVKNRRKRVR